MSRQKRKAPRVETAGFPVEFWAWVLAQFQNQQTVSPVYLSRADAERHAPHMHISNGYRLVPADPRRDAVVRAAAQWSAARERLTRLEESGGGAHAIAKAENELANWSAWLSLKSAAVEKLQKGRRK